jgi:FtsX-like permease family
VTRRGPAGPGARSQALQVARYRLRATIGHRAGTLAAMAILTGLVAGLAMASVTAARRTSSSYPDYLASSNPSDLLVVPSTQSYAPGLIRELARLPHVRSAEGAADFNAVTLSGQGRVATLLMTQVELVASADGLFSDQDRLTMLAGHAADPRDPDQVVATNEAASVLGLHVGSRIEVGVDRNGSHEVLPLYRRLRLTVVGIAGLSLQLVHDQVDTDRAGFLVGTPALARQFGPCCATNSYDGLQLRGGARYDTAAEQEYERLATSSPYTRASSGQLVVYITSSIEAEAQQAVRPEAVALAVFGLIAGLAALIIGLQFSSRLLVSAGEDSAVLRALGAGPPAILADGLVGILAATVAGAGVAIGVATAISPLTLFGPVRAVEPARGPYLDWAVLGLGAVALAAVLSAAAIWTAYRQLPHRLTAAHRRPIRLSSLVRATVAGGLPPAAVAGIRFGLEPGRGRTAVPTQSVLAGAVLAVTVVAATVTFGAGLNTLISRPALYGWNFSYAMFSVDGYGSVPSRWSGPLLHADKSVAAWTGVYFTTVQINGQTVPAIAGPVHPAVGPQVLSGHGLDSAGQITLGPQTLRQLRLRVGDTVTVSEGRIVPPTVLRIAGTAAMPTIGDSIGVHASLSTGAYFATGIVPRALLDEYGPISGPNALLIRLRPGASPAAALGSLQLITRELNADSRSPVGESVLGDLPRYLSSVTLLPVQRPAEITNYKSMGAVPAILAAGLAAGALAGLGLTMAASVRRRRRDFAVLKTLGFTRGQVAGAVAWQATAVAVTGIVVGIPAGIAAGRWLWIAFAHQLSAVPEPVVPALPIVLTACGALALANIVALGPGWRAARTATAAVLRAE